MSTSEFVSRDDEVAMPLAHCRSPLGTFAECPMCGGTLAPEHAHFR